VLSQPVALAKWLFAKLIFRFSIIFGLVILCLFTALLTLGLPFKLMDILWLLLLTGIYISLYFLISFLVNLFSRNSGTNAVILVSIWVFFVMIFPAIIGLLSTVLYPVPSRVKQLSEMRSEEKHAKEKGSKLLASFYEDHPELAVLEAPNEDAALKKYNDFWKIKYVVAKNITEHTQPIVEHHTQQIQSRRDLAGTLRFLSPAILYQESLHEIAGTSSRHYLAYQQQVQSFYVGWRKFLSEKVFRGQKMTKNDLLHLPQFNFQTDLFKRHLYTNTAVIFLYAVILLLLSVLLRRPVEKMV
jgi:ABC-2 type transport system permease protein